MSKKKSANTLPFIKKETTKDTEFKRNKSVLSTSVEPELKKTSKNSNVKISQRPIELDIPVEKDIENHTTFYLTQMDLFNSIMNSPIEKKKTFQENVFHIGMLIEILDEIDLSDPEDREEIPEIVETINKHHQQIKDTLSESEYQSIFKTNKKAPIYEIEAYSLLTRYREFN